MTNLPSSEGTGDLDNLAVTRAEFRNEIGLLLEYLAQALGDVTGDYTTETVNPQTVILQGQPTIEAGANPNGDDATQRIPSTKWVKESGVYSGDSGYGAPVKAQLWVDTSTPQYTLKAYNQSDTDWQLIGGFSSGTRMLFQQQTAPLGWTKDTSADNSALRVVSGTPTVVSDQQSFSTVFSSVGVTGTVSPRILNVAQMPSHSHVVDEGTGHNHTIDVNDPGHRHSQGMSGGNHDGGGKAGGAGTNTGSNVTGVSATSRNKKTFLTIRSSGSSASHDHGFSGGNLDLSINYVDVIIAEKD